MSYATRQELLKRFSELEELADGTHVDEVVGVPEVIEDLNAVPPVVGVPAVIAVPGVADNIDLALDDATDEMNSYIARRYTVPVAEGYVLKPLVMYCCDIARFLLYKDRPTDEIRKRYESAIEWLKLLNAGKVTLVADPAFPPTLVDDFTSPVTAFSKPRNPAIGAFSDNRLDRMPDICGGFIQDVRFPVD